MAILYWWHQSVRKVPLVFTALLVLSETSPPLRPPDVLLVRYLLDHPDPALGQGTVGMALLLHPPPDLPQLVTGQTPPLSPQLYLTSSSVGTAPLCQSPVKTSQAIFIGQVQHGYPTEVVF